MISLQYRPIGPKEGHSAGRELLRQMTESLTGRPMPPILLTERGKPYFTQGPHFSISHSRRHVFCALSDRPIGIDAEEADRDISLAIAPKILSPSELAQLEAAADKRTALLTFWVLKEALLKFRGTGITCWPNDTHFSLNDPRVRRLGGCLVAVIEEDDYAL